MNTQTIMRLQADMQSVGLYDGDIDGAWGLLTLAASQVQLVR